jgi:hypothetical protein
MNRRSFPTVVSFVLALAVSTTAVAAQETLSSARDLYASADYERALAALNRIRSNGVNADDVPAVEQYRALCLLALGRSHEAEDAIAAIVSAAPSYSPPGSEVSPRVRSAFSEVRRKVLPTIIQQKYAEAKAAYDRKAYAAASDGFAQVLKALADPDVAPLATQPPLSDLRTLSQGFADLSLTAVAAMAPPPAPVAPPAPAGPPPIRIYTVTDANVVPPAILRQALPPYYRKPVTEITGVLEVVINEAGHVEVASMRTPIDPVYDKTTINATRNWRYQPATRNGTPVKFRKLVQVKIQP